MPQQVWLAADPAKTFWRLLIYFNGYRLGVAAVFFSAIHFFGTELNFGLQNSLMFSRVCIVYLLTALGFHLVLWQFKRGFNIQLTIQVVTDIVALTLLMYYSGGAKSGMAFMLLIVLAGASLVGQGRLSLFFAALATLAVLLEQLLRVLRFDADPVTFVQSGIISIGFFATAITARLLARRVVANENLAWQRGKALSEQLSINARVIRDMQDGVLVVDATGRVLQANPRVLSLLGWGSAQPVPGAPLSDWSKALDECFCRWMQEATEVIEIVQPPDVARSLRVRFLPAGEGGNALIYLEDMERIEERAQQMKLAALGRLTANMAHEIRNPLSAISHAAELLAEEQRDATRVRLTRIIGDNTQRLNRLVAEVLELGRRDRVQPELLHLQGFLGGFLEEFFLHDPSASGLVVCALDGDATLWFDRSHLNRVLWNLLHNAVRHCQVKPGSIRMEVRSITQPGQRGRTEIHVIDDGAGIDPAFRSQIFEPFFTTHSSGTGLGLYIARELCEANGAQLDLNESFSGAHFSIVGRCEGDQRAFASGKAVS